MNNFHYMITVIVPIYNAEKTINRCVDSILQQTYTDFELLLIDDGSIDRSGDICDEYAEKDNRIRVFHKQNGGVSSARNLGLEKASGYWITFIDADDWIETNCLEKCLTDSHYEYDLIMFSCKWAIDSRLPDKLCIKQNDFAEILPKYIDKITFVTPWCKLFKREIVDNYNIRFDVRFSSGEDTLFSFEYLTVCNRMRLLSYEGYHYVVDESDLTLSKIKSIDWQVNCLFFNAISEPVILLEKKYGISLNKFRCLYGEYRLNKYLSLLPSLSIADIKQKISVVSQTPFLNYLFSDNIYMPKGERRLLFDYFIKHGLFVLLAIYIKFFRAEY